MISSIKNPWMKSTKANDEYKTQKALVNDLVKKAKALLADEKFVEYRKIYELYHASEIENIMMLGEQDPIKYAFKVRQIVDTLKAYRLLISSIEENASIQVEEEK